MVPRTKRDRVRSFSAGARSGARCDLRATSTGSPYLGNTGAYYCVAAHSSSCIAYAATTFKSSPLRMRVAGRDTGGRVNRRIRWFENPSPRPHIASHSQPHDDELSPDSAKGLTFSGLLRTLERRFTIERRGGAIGESRSR
jgi:hypothetical protein